MLHQRHFSVQMQKEASQGIPVPCPEVNLILLIEDVGQMAPSTVLSILHGRHEDTGTALS